MRILTDTETCVGCRICELACSLHHAGSFLPEESSIRITRNNQNGEVNLFIDSTCDLCQEEAQPLCLKYCLYGALREVE